MYQINATIIAWLHLQIYEKVRQRQKEALFYYSGFAGPYPIICVKCKYSETRPISDGFRKNNVNYWAFREIRSIIPHL